ncbi:MAG TPA: response regulator transcription factor [Candidatus Acidoferrales bacterium]|nr:response regulator transcription factor [Candidatus Acidoferrales bacterium]
MAGTILIVEDEPQIGEVLAGYLQADGFVAVVRGTYAQAIEALEQGRPDLLLLDVTLPDGSGLDILRRVREREIPAIVVTGRADEVDRIVGLEIGADDYITKPFSPREVVARVRAVLRRAHAGDAGASTHGEVLRIGDLEIDVEAHEVRIGAKPARLTPSEFRLLEVLARNAGAALTRSQLLDKLSDDGSIFERTLDRHINNLRRKIEPDVANPVYVLTVYGVGYKVRKP